MATQLQLRKQLTSVNNIKHITEAMEVVAGVKFRKLSRRADHFRLFASKLTEIVDRLKQAGSSSKHPLFVQRETKKIGVIIVAGDKGLCGSYNENVIKKASRFLKKYSKDQVELVLFGNKAVKHFNKGYWSVKSEIPDWTKKLSEGNVNFWSTQLSDSYAAAEYDELWIVYTSYKNVMSREVRVEQLLPLKINGDHEKPKAIDFIFEPDPEEIYNKIIPFYFFSKIQSLLFDSYSSELSSRLVSMKAATKNAEEMIEKLTLIKNKNRQFGITREILEITAGAEVLK